ncbi:MAG: hypothetical protein ILA19_05455 [Bacilli bacterium]|nr:hypothetical protein [Bacilli bacterium]
MEKLTEIQCQTIIVIILAIIVITETILRSYNMNIDQLSNLFWLIAAFELGILIRPRIIKEDKGDE